MWPGQEIAENIRRCRSEGELDLALEYAYDGIEKFSEIGRASCRERV